jgi:hypothetical protein
MKKTIGLLILVLLAGAACYRYVPYGESGSNYPSESPYDRYDTYDRYDNLDIRYFYDYLAPYGMWVSYRPYGYVWVPANVGYSWRPYTRGYWVWSDYGWTWVSLERWGWIAFHYGRWGWDRRLGWFWVPDVVWGPAWVGWRWGDSHIGWAPLPPGVDFVPGRGFGRPAWNIPGHHWNFVRGRYFIDRTLDRWILPVERNVTIINLTRFDVNINVRDRRVVNEGVDVDLVRRLTGRTVAKYALKESTRPGEARDDGRELIISKPVINRNETARPKQVVDENSAERQLASGTSGRIYRSAPRDEEKVMRENHVKEQRLMRESQEIELNEIRRRVEDDRQKIVNPDEKRKLEEQSSSRIAELKKKHDQEKAELEKRQKAEEAKSKKSPVRKKVEKTDKD